MFLKIILMWLFDRMGFYLFWGGIIWLNGVLFFILRWNYLTERRSMLQSYIVFIASLGLIFYLFLNWGEIIGVRGTEGYIIPITSLGLHPFNVG